MKLADVQSVNNPDSALELYSAAQRRLDELPDKDRKELPNQRLLASLLRHQAQVLAEIGRAGESIPLYEDGAKLYSSVAALDPANLRAQWDLAVVLKDLGDAKARLGKNDEAAAAYERVVNTLEPLVERNAPVQLRRAYGEALVLLGGVRCASGQPRTCRSAASKGLAILREGMDNPDVPRAEVERTAEALLVAQPADLQDPAHAATMLERARLGDPRPTPNFLALLAEAQWRTGRQIEAGITAREGLALLPAPVPGQPKSHTRERLERRAQSN
jgi:tetratricopeptide (TPR) repeat protein